LVKGAVAVAYRFKISPLVVGMTVVSFGTSAPELLVSVQAALDGHPAISIGNIIGSNISNLALVLGLTALIFPMPVRDNTIKIDWPVMMGASLLFYGAIAFDSLFNWYEGLIFVLLLVTFIYWMISKSRKENKQVAESNHTEEIGGIGKSLVLVIVGFAGLALGAKWLLDGAVSIATGFGISEHIIGVTIVAFGTSVPELTTSCIAAIRKQTDISLGNLIGSNLFNILAILGITGMVHEIPISEEVLSYDIFWMLGISFLILPFVLFDRKINRVEGGILFATYLLYVFFLL
ncbi:calcium/sodium antiporter, partial [Flavobacteriales bacterium]|nr:calcium/sodium antiporter [Flavobacteriales bacterium]